MGGQQKMKFTILRIDKRIVTGELDDGTIIDVARKWFTEDIEEGDTIDFTVQRAIITNKIIA